MFRRLSDLKFWHAILSRCHRPPRPRAPAPPTSLAGRVLPQLGAAFVAAVAYVDPGNFATNIAGGAEFGYLLLWVVLSANLMGILDPEPVGQGRRRDGQEPPRTVPRALPEARLAGPVGAGRADRDGHRPRRVRRRRDRPQPPLRHPAVPGRPDHRGRRVRRARPAERSGYRRFEVTIAGMLAVILLGLHLRHAAGRRRRRRHRRRLRARLRGLRERAVRRRHPRRDRDAARDLPALRADVRAQRARRRTRRRSASSSSSASTSAIAMTLAGLVNMAMLIIAASLFHEHGRRGRHARGGARRVRVDGRQRHGDRVRHRAARVRLRELQRRHARRPGRDAGLHRPHDPAVPAPPRDDAPGARRAGDRRRPDARARHLPGRPVVRHPVRADPARW